MLYKEAFNYQANVLSIGGSFNDIETFAHSRVSITL